MQEALVTALRARRPQIRARWEALLRVERVNTPLANPDTLVHLIDLTLDDILQRLSHPRVRRTVVHSVSFAAIRALCPCGRNPLLAYFLAGEQAMLEAVVLAQSELPPTDAAERSAAVAELYHAMRKLAHQEVEAFCSVCQHRTAVEPTHATTAHAAPGCHA